MRKRDAFDQCHPAVNFLFFLGAIGFAVMIQHPAYIAASCIGAALYYLLANPGKGWKAVLGLMPVPVFVAAINPLFNHDGQRILFYLFGNPYTLEALYYGLAVGGILLAMMLWFLSYSRVMTSDKFICLFGSAIPSLSLLLTMVLRMIPNLVRKAGAIVDSRRAIGKGLEGKDKGKNAAAAVSALTDWALESSIVTADSMRARGYGSAKRTSFRIYRMSLQDWCLLVILTLLAVLSILPGGFEAAYTPQLQLADPTWGLAAYCAYLLIPIILQVKEALTWHILISRI